MRGVEAADETEERTVDENARYTVSWGALLSLFGCLCVMCTNMRVQLRIR